MATFSSKTFVNVMVSYIISSSSKIVLLFARAKRSKILGKIGKIEIFQNKIF